MVVRCEESIEVRAPLGGTLDPGSAGPPDSFLWRGRLYQVRAVLGQWQEEHPWWRQRGEFDRPLASRDRRVWRVRASPGRLATMEIFDLGVWTGPGDGSDRSRWTLRPVAEGARR